jgi:hypothetical protein
MPGYIHKLYPPVIGLLYNPTPPIVDMGMLFLTSSTDDMLFLDSGEMLYLGA